MHKVNDCIGLVVFSQITGQVVGKITDISFSPNLDRVNHLLVDDKNSNGVKLCQPLNISSLGRDAVLVNTKDLPSGAVGNEGEILLSKLKGLNIISSAGKELGEVVDVLFKLPHCEIKALEISEGFIGDILIGRHSISKYAIQKISQDCILVDF